ncbi:Na+/H+ antiporter [Streptomyces sp. VRA16 Mangrove soil]|uniref:Na+/H+ antiporter n=1 Tax=Streptomyces sp. VRA16 Mangrove soil TaxID=2817434 RepID=UPI001A9CED33|nr:Na+/H+ antiporter [Streptomyces sp. VRA16 Mangrove soil]MBO1329920.1 Na+/H+ antiporter [Streptomyces sp. VRA16 Mangrove soil]
MLGLVLVVLLGIAVLLGSAGGERLGIAPPVVLLALGVLIGLVPALRAVELPSEVVLLLFLPVLLFWESMNTSLREIRRHLTDVGLAATLLVLASAAAVACVAHAMGLDWGPAWVLGAAVAPTDATAVGVVARLLPRRDITLLRAESLLNDGTALVVYGIAVGVTVGTEQVTAVHVSGLFVLGYGGGALIGAAAGALVQRLRARTADGDALRGQVLLLLTPFSAYLVAEYADASGVVAVVVCGLMLSQSGPRVVRAEVRVQAQNFWTVATYLLNGSLFVLVGIELVHSVLHLRGDQLPRALGTALAVAGTLVAVRFAYYFAVAAFFRVVRRGTARASGTTYSARRLTVSALSGFRGAISLAAALGVPATLHSGSPFPDRELIVFVTGLVIVVTMAQAVILPGVVRWARIPVDRAVAREEWRAESDALNEALTALPALAERLDTAPQITEAVRVAWQAEADALALRCQAAPADLEVHPQRLADDATALRLALLAERRAVVVRLRDRGDIDDTVLRRLQGRLDSEELHLLRHVPVE